MARKYCLLVIFVINRAGVNQERNALARSCASFHPGCGERITAAISAGESAPMRLVGLGDLQCTSPLRVGQHVHALHALRR